MLTDVNIRPLQLRYSQVRRRYLSNVGPETRFDDEVCCSSYHGRYHCCEFPKRAVMLILNAFCALDLRPSRLGTHCW